MIRFDSKRQGTNTTASSDGAKRASHSIRGVLQAASSCFRQQSAVRTRPDRILAPAGARAGTEGGGMLRNVRILHSLIGIGLLGALGAVPIACSDDEFSGCAASRTCPSANKGGETGGGGEAGGETDTGGSSGSSTGGRPSTGGSAGSNGGRGGASTGGAAASTGEGGEPFGGTGGGGTNSGGEGGMEDPTDTTPPTIVSVSPANGATGVVANENIVITFSEPMDRSSTQDAFQSTDILPSTVAYFWNQAGTVLTINPASDFEYASGTDPGATARAYAVAITTTAEDESGNRLADDFEWSFRTMRRITQTIPVPYQNVLVVNSGTMGTYSSCGSETAGAFAGDWDDNSGFYILVSADISDLPAGIVEWEAASLAGYQNSYDGDPYAALGLITAYHLRVSPPTSARWTTPIRHTLGYFSTNILLETKAVDILVALTDDYSMSQLSQYRLSFSDLTNNDNNNQWAIFTCNRFSITARYVLP